ncbi:Vacuolar iron transporter 1 [Diplonema papillatum]|nr:Vacuolar iron transporter 1 [Diplonema papillatum]|eukprot:gene20409-31412_t
MDEHTTLLVGTSRRKGLSKSTSRRGQVEFDDDHIDMDGSFKAAIFGFNDGLCSNTCLMVGIASASNINPTAVLASGMVGLFSGAFSMAAGEWISLTLQNRAEEGEIEKEKDHIKQNQAAKEKKLANELKEEYGLSDRAVSILYEDLRKGGVDRLTKFHAKMQLGLDTDDTRGNPVKSMLFMMLSFAMGAIVPLFPWIPAWYPGPGVAVGLSISLALAASTIVGYSMTYFTAEAGWRTALRQIISAAVAIGAVWGVGLVYGALGGDPAEALG